MASCHHLLRLWYKIAFLCALDLRLLMPKEDSNKEDKTSAFLFQPAKVAPCLSGLSKAGLTGFRKNLPRCACGIFPESLAQSGTGLFGRQEIKIGSRTGKCLTEKIWL